MSAAAERQMRTWAISLESLERRQKEELAAAKAPKVLPYLAISREAGCDCAELATAIAARCGWKVFDNELIDYLADKHHWSRVALEHVDERTVSWFHETFGRWLDNKLVSQLEYVRSLGKVVILAAQHESVVIVGRGAQFFLPREAGLSVRIIAPRKQRAERMMARIGGGRAEAERVMDEIDRGRAELVRQYFHHDVTDAHLYDVVINLEHVSRESLIEIVVEALEGRSKAAG
jgi:hypothetical protein